MNEGLDVYIQSVILSLFAIIVFFAGYLLRWFFAGKKLREAESQAKELIEASKKDAENRKKEIELQAKDAMIKLRQDFEKETKERREEIAALEKR
ncbi:MAG: DUF3552 domain-containing protein, partial [Candidatus Omnitrophica bacterium]|nr:DUF3552 domain-containing protein [Candidatus Omnitrophota bacterium]